MQIYNEILLEGVTIDEDVTSQAISVGQLFVGSIQAVWTGTPGGNIIVEASNDKESPTNWTAIATQAAGGAAGSKLFDLANIGYKWVRLFYDFSSSTGTLSATAMFKGP